jgi:Fe-S cluster assembly protein SufD
LDQSGIRAIRKEMIEDLKFEIENLNIASAVNFVLPLANRNRAAEILQTLEYPTTRMEAWKYTRVAKIKNTKFSVSKIADENLDLAPFLIPNLKGSRIVFVNGFYQEKLSVFEEESGISISSLSQNPTWIANYMDSILPIDGEYFNAMNSYTATDGVAIHIAKKSNIQQSVQVIFINSCKNTYASNRNVIVCEDFASAHISLGFFSENADNSFQNVVSEIFVGTNANLTIDKLQLENESSFTIATEQVKQEKDATFTINTITLDGGLVRNNLSIAVDGQNSETNLSGAYVLRGKQHVDNHTVVDHKVAHCVSNELYKGVMDENSTAVFNGKVFVRKDAQKINAFQSNGNVLLSDNATINSKPELEIYADDVKCSHGSTTGQLDEEAVFYLRARGISEKSARALMVAAFIGEVLEKIENEAIRDFVDQKLLEKFGWEMS